MTQHLPGAYCEVCQEYLEAGELYTDFSIVKYGSESAAHEIIDQVIICMGCVSELPESVGLFLETAETMIARAANEGDTPI